MLMLWPSLLLLSTLYLVGVKNVNLRLLKAVDVVVDVALLVVTGHIIFSCGQ